MKKLLAARPIKFPTLLEVLDLFHNIDVSRVSYHIDLICQQGASLLTLLLKLQESPELPTADITDSHIGVFFLL